MFEKEAEDRAFEKYPIPQVWNELDFARNVKYEEGFKDGAEFGYNKANEWHKVVNGDLPKEDLRQRTHGYYLTVSKYERNKWLVFEVAYFTGTVFTKGGNILDNVIAWKEIVLPKLKEIE